MDTHVKVVGWLWIANGVVSILMVVFGLIIANVYIPGQQESVLVTNLAYCVVSFPESPQILQLASACFSTNLGLASLRSFWGLSI